MRSRRTVPDPQRQAQMLARLQRKFAESQQSYRQQALRLLPHVCASCGREFSGRRLKELTVHHKDHNPQNNPPDGSNWELLCMYCHDREHEKHQLAGQISDAACKTQSEPAKIADPFARLDELLRHAPPAK